MDKKLNWLYTYAGLPNNLYILGFSKLVTSLLSFIIPFLSLFLTVKLGIKENLAGVLVTLVTLTYIPGSIMGGIFSDKFSKKNVLVVSQFISALFLISVPFTNSVVLEMILISLANFMASASYPAINSLIAETVSQKQIKTAYSFVYLCQNFGVAVGSFLASRLFYKHMNALFIIDALTTIASVLMIFIFIHEMRTSKSYSIENKKSLTTIQIFLKNTNLIIFTIICMMYYFCYAQYSFSLPLHLKHYFLENGVTYYGIIMTCNAICVITLTPIITHITKPYNSILNMVVAGIAFGFGFGLYFFSNKFIMLVISTIIWTIGEILMATNFNTYITEKTPREYLGRITSLVSVISNIGLYSNPLIMGFIINSFGTLIVWPSMFFLMIISSGIMLYIYLIERRLKLIHDSTAETPSKMLL